jgi:hypothetical protein
MSNRGGDMRRKTRFVSLGILVALVGLAPSMAVAAPPTTETITYAEQRTDMDVVCSGAIVPIELDLRGVIHITEFDDGRFHFTITETGTFTTVDAGVTYTGRFTFWAGENSNTKSFNGTFTFSARGKGDDGSRLLLQGVGHFSVNANGEVTREFERFTVTC